MLSRAWVGGYVLQEAVEDGPRVVVCGISGGPKKMATPARASEWALKKATQLGAHMSRAESGINPRLRQAHEYTSYIQFIQAHRYELEQLPVFREWDHQLSRLIEQERTMVGATLQTRREIDAFNAQIAVPMRCAFWYGWESAMQLKQRYDEHVADKRRAESSIQVIKTAASPLAPRVTCVNVNQQVSEEDELPPHCSLLENAQEEINQPIHPSK